MYGYFRKFAGPRLAGLICAVWFCALIIAILAASVEPPAAFDYANY